jgi:hypothetical protein
MITLTIDTVFLLLTCVHFWVWGVLRRLSACAPTAYEVARDCRNFEKHCFRGWKGVRLWLQFRYVNIFSDWLSSNYSTCCSFNGRLLRSPHCAIVR